MPVFGTIAVNYYANTRPFNGQTMGAVSAKYPTPLTPAGYAFGIWGLIFLGLSIYAVWQLLPAQRRLVLAVIASSLAGLIVDSVVFLSLAFGSLDYLAGQIVGKSWAVLISIPFIRLLRRATPSPA